MRDPDSTWHYLASGYRKSSNPLGNESDEQLTYGFPRTRARKAGPASAQLNPGPSIDA